MEEASTPEPSSQLSTWGLKIYAGRWRALIPQENCFLRKTACESGLCGLTGFFLLHPQVAPLPREAELFPLMCFLPQKHRETSAVLLLGWGCIPPSAVKSAAIGDTVREKGRRWS